MTDLIHCAASGNAPASGGAEGAAAVIVAAGARQAAAAGRTVQLTDSIAIPHRAVGTS